MNSKKGFTLVEAALVLGVGGLIFLMVFLALPALTGTARDADRRNNVLTFLQKLKDFQTNNNRGALPVVSAAEEATLRSGGAIFIDGSLISSQASASSMSWKGFYRDFLAPEFTAPNGIEYNLRIAKCLSATDTTCVESAFAGLNDDTSDDNTLYVVLGAVCDGDLPKSSPNQRRVAVLHKMERTENAYCSNT